MVKGIGNVGRFLVNYLNESNANIYVTDINKKRLDQISTAYPVNVVEPEKIFDHNYDIICPCDTDFLVTYQNVNKIRTEIIVGATNNQLESVDLAENLLQNNVLFFPGFLVNAGGLICATKLYERADIKDIEAEVRNIYHSTKKVLSLSKTENITTLNAANIMINRILKENHKGTLGSSE